MKLEQLQYFVMAGKYEHIGKAAKAISISPSAISHSIAALEEELGRDLFEKKGKRIFLTAHGKFLMEKAKGLLQEAEAIREELQSDQVQLRGHYRIAGTHLLCARYLISAWAGIQEQNPELTSEIYTLRSAQVISGVLGGEYDFGVCFNPQSHPEVSSQVVRSGQLLIALRKSHPIFRKKPADRYAMLSDLPAVMPKAFQGVDVCERHPMFEKFKIIVKPKCLFDSYEVAMKQVALSSGWGFIPDWLVEENSDEIRALEVPKGWDAPFFITCVWPKGRLMTEALKRLTISVEQSFAKIPTVKKRAKTSAEDKSALPH